MAISPRRFKRIRGIVAQLHQLAMPTKVPPEDATGSDECMGDEIMDWLSRNPELDLDDLESCEDPDEVDDHDDDDGKCNHKYQKGLLNGSAKEPSRKRLRSLQAILKLLLESPSIKWVIRIKDVQNASFKDLDITDHECT
ncbi:hypothetical protein BGX34_007510, partial [Mortierella sp. NVP85]